MKLSLKNPFSMVKVAKEKMVNVPGVRTCVDCGKYAFRACICASLIGAFLEMNKNGFEGHGYQRVASLAPEIKEGQRVKSVKFDASSMPKGDVLDKDVPLLVVWENEAPERILIKLTVNNDIIVAVDGQSYKMTTDSELIKSILAIISDNYSNGSGASAQKKNKEKKEPLKSYRDVDAIVSDTSIAITSCDADAETTIEKALGIIVALLEQQRSGGSRAIVVPLQFALDLHVQTDDERFESFLNLVGAFGVQALVNHDEHLVAADNGEIIARVKFVPIGEPEKR